MNEPINFWSLFKESTIMSAFVVVLSMSALTYLAVTGHDIPQVLIDINLIVVSFFFGTKAARMTSTRTNREGQNGKSDKG